ncbi:ferric-rhodotorulic acid/ferric-coprogen receptor FhuE [Achromobacter deleyi]|uniref:ferric-rhodotorulic acid/ferric-coprogen receptor FhuE n=1 Tax=Achromobacter deleyi TaxID=1353891 RepID=UPI0014920D5A|nr:ferric-rhodotorulic acid/ferric-coprogen receptor FhuE [Achromobacter deleyi]QVQ27809.1 ferric-rhodotorulic acid/ferric-coprogen receptor FhuE [Achromobacter deleyi]UIP23413.1 ferric-rhodotorulic acid/ferric-coprogen receptor FhuE [Achromobacter deleyi]
MQNHRPCGRSPFVQRRFVLRRTSGLVLLALTSGVAMAQDSSVATLPTVQVVGDTASTTTEGTGSYTPRATAASTGLSLSLRETPQSVTVMTRQRMDDEDMRSLADVMASTPGISVQNFDSERYSFNSRGFSISNYMYDGVPTAFDVGYAAGESSVDPIIYDRVEVVRGATGLMTGAGNPSASINLVRKHADSREFKADLSAGVGTWDTYRATADLSTPLNSDGSVRGRIVSAYQDNHSFLDHYQNRKTVFYGVVDADLSARTTMSVGYNYQDNDPQGSSWGGFPLWYADGGRTDWRRSLNTGAKWTSWGSTTQGAFASLEHRFDNEWRVQAVGSHSKNEMDAKLLYLYGWPDRETGEGMGASPAWYLGDRKQNALDLKASGPFTMFGRRHEAVVGASFNRQKGDFDSKSALSVSDVGNFLNWNGSYPEPDWSDTAVTASRYTTTQTGWYGALRLNLADPLKLIVGGRYSTWKTNSVGFGGEGRTEFDKNDFTPYAGLLYDINDTYTAYVSYTGIFNPQSYQDRNANWLDPLEGKSYEAGIKGEFLEGRLNASAAVFQIDQDNVAQVDPGQMVPGTTNQAYTAAKGTRSRGFDLEVSGEVTPGWNVAAGWSHWTARDGDGNAIQTDQPRSLVRVFTTYQLPGDWNRLTVGGGVNWQSNVYTIASGPNGDERVGQGSYAITNLMARYRFNRSLSAQLNVNNLFDRKYYSQIGFYSQGAWAAGRSAMLTMRYQY